MKFKFLILSNLLAGCVLLNAQVALRPMVAEATRLAEMRDFTGAIRLLNGALAVDSLQQQAYTLLGTSFLNIGRPDSALVVTDKGSVFYPDDLFLTLTRAEALNALERHEEALPLYLEVHKKLEDLQVSASDATVSSLRSRISMLYAFKANELFQRDDVQAAARNLRLALEFQPYDQALYRSLVIIHLGMKNWKDAGNIASEGLNIAGPDTILLRLKVKAQYELKDYRGLLRTAEQLNALVPRSPEAHLLYAEALLLNERTVEGVAKLATMIDLFPDVRESYGALIDLHKRRMDFQGVAAILEKEAKQFPNDAAVRRSLAETYEILGKWENARSAYRDFGRISGDQVTGALLQAKTFEMEDSSSGAIKAYGRILLENPGQPDALAGLGRIYNGLHRWAEAVEVFKKLNEKRPDAIAAGLLGWSLEQSGELTHAREWYWRAVQWQTPHPLPYYRLSIMLKDTSRSASLELAETGLRKALAIVEQSQQVVMEDVRQSPDFDRREERERHEEASGMVETIFYYMLSQYDSADLQGMIDRVLAMHPGSGRLHFLSGILHRTAGSRDDALEQFSLGARYSPGHAAIHAALGQELEVRNRLSEALLAYERAIALEPSKPEHYAAVLRVSERQGVLEHLCDRWLARYRARRDNLALKEALVAALHKAGRLETAAEILREKTPDQ